MNVKTVMKTRITNAPTVQPISRRVLPWIWAATMLRRGRARYLTIAHTSAPATPMKTIQARMKISR